MSFLSVQARASLRNEPPGLELVRYWQTAAGSIGVPARALLSMLASSLLARGWLHPLDKTLESAHETLGEPVDALRKALDELVAVDLVGLDGDRITTVAGLLSTRPTGLDFRIDAAHEVHLTGPLAALAVARALQKPGEIRGVSSADKSRVVLVCDESGVTSRDPETICMFLPSWDGTERPSALMAAGGLFADDEQLGKWQEDKGDPPGMPLPSMLFPMAAVDLGAQLGSALEPVLSHLPDFD